MSISPRHRSKRRRRIARVLLVGGLELAAAAALVSVIANSSSAPAGAADTPPLTTETVAAKPAAYRSRDIQVQGRVADWPERIKRRDEGTFVIEGARGARLLVVPAEAQRLQAFKVGTTCSCPAHWSSRPTASVSRAGRRAGPRSPSAPMHRRSSRPHGSGTCGDVTSMEGRGRANGGQRPWSRATEDGTMVGMGFLPGREHLRARAA